MSSDQSPVILWFRRDLRLSDHPALTEAVASGRPVIPVFVCDETVETMGAAPKWRLGLGIAAFARTLQERGTRLILRRGNALEVLRGLIAETGAGAVYWTRGYDPEAIARDTAVKAALKEDGCDVRSFAGHVLFEPWTVETGAGSYYKVYSPFWKTVHTRDVAPLLPAPGRLAGPEAWPASDDLDDWALGRAMNRGAEIVGQHVTVGEAAAMTRLETFIEEKVSRYADLRDVPSQDVTSGLSENLAWGEISPVRCWHVGIRARQGGSPGAEKFLKEVVWRDFAYHLVYHTPRITSQNWRPEWDAFAWSDDADSAVATAWRQGRTGMAMVDAALREMYVTGRMHNRARMVVASYLTKHLMTHWRVGQAWFSECLIDWDPASNAMGWQWVAGCGPDAAPYFRIFNPEGQAKKFDPKGIYIDRWIAEGRAEASPEALSYFDAVPRSWGLSPADAYPDPVVSARDGREAALAAYETRGF